MLYILKLSIRNIFRNTRRSILAVTSVFLAVVLIVFLQGFLGGFLNSLTKNSTKNDTGHILITTKEYHERKEFMPVDANIENPDEIIASIKENEKISKEIDLITERFRIGVLLSHDGNNKSAIALAGDREKEKDLLMLHRSIIEGRYIQGGHEVVVGKQVADSLNLSTSNYVEVVQKGNVLVTNAYTNVLKILTKSSEGSPALYVANVVGIFKTGMALYDDVIFQIPLDDTKEALRTYGGAQQILIMIKDHKRATPVAKMIEKHLSDDTIAVTPWTEAGGFGQLVLFADAIYGLIYIVVAFLGTIIIANIMMMVVLERRKEIGIMKSMGISNTEVLWIFLFEGVTLGTIGCIFGIAVGTAINIYLNKNGIDFSQYLSTDTLMYPMESIIYTTLSLPGIIQVFIIGIVVSGFVSVLPAMTAAKMRAVDAIKSV